MSQLIKPALLQTGDKIALIAPAGLIEPELIQSSLKVFEKWGLVVEQGAHLFAIHHQFAGNDKQRQADMQWALDDEEIKAIICARGGYGCMRIADKLNWNKFKTTPKWVCGFSDITVFHSAIHQLGICSGHTLMPLNMAKLSINASQIETLGRLLFKGKLSYSVNPHNLNQKGTEKAELFGGNLSLLYALNGTKFDFDWSEKILFIEDVGEQYYHLDRMIQSLRLSGKFEKLNGLIVGGLSEMHDKKRPFGKTPEEIISDAVREYDYPVVFGFPAGHIENNNSLILGAEVALQVTDSEVQITM